MKMIARSFIGAALVSVLVACSSTTEQTEESLPEEVVEETVVEETTTTETSTSTAESTPTSSLVAFARNAINDPASPLNQKVIYFDYDASSILDEYQQVITNHAQYLSDYGDVKVRLEGHADERGTREYNIALGERRAEAVRRLLLLQGVSVNQVSIISYGEELPAALAHDEEAWSLNRRVELVYEAQ
ncbi:MAG: peptidoglycan-associated lipoprotein Pal [Pseudomonadota bacterium]